MYINPPRYVAYHVDDTACTARPSLSTAFYLSCQILSLDTRGSPHVFPHMKQVSLPTPTQSPPTPSSKDRRSANESLRSTQQFTFNDCFDRCHRHVLACPLPELSRWVVGQMSFAIGIPYASQTNSRPFVGHQSNVSLTTKCKCFRAARRLSP